MNEVVKVRMNSWAAMIKARNESGMTIRDWCKANDVSESAYYYRLSQLRNSALENMSESSEEQNETPFVHIRKPESISGVSVRIRHGETIIEIDNNANETLLSFLKEVLIHAV
ncbi:MAG: IS66 family insertion sequence element accessory protein TnpB [Clostridia bacterium]|nr:IS66 family insertion sequence element accessory protein TnpB [Clostridia bacterium]